MDRFVLHSPFRPVAEQNEAVERLDANVRSGRRAQVLLGVTGSGKTFTLANLIVRLQRPTLVISHNKTLAAQLYGEFREFFPENAVEYFVSYYDYYQPEAYIPQTDVYIEKDASINERLDRLRLAATTSLLSRRDVIIVASVSCIYNLGSPEDYREQLVFLEEGADRDRDAVLMDLVRVQYERNDVDFARGRIRVRGEVLDVFPAYRQDALRILFDGDRIERISMIDPVTGEEIRRLPRTAVYPAKHFLVSPPRLERALEEIRAELDLRLAEFTARGRLLEAQRLKTRTDYDLEMLEEMGYCHGIENYARALSGRPPGSRPACLLDYFPEDFFLIVDESHVTVPQIRGMYEGDRARKEVLVEHGFRLPSCLDNRPLRFDEFMDLVGDRVYVSATPGAFEVRDSGGCVVEQVIRPTGIPDPVIHVRPTSGQVADLVAEIRKRASRNQRVLATTLTKRMAEDLTDYLKDQGLAVKYLHSGVETIDRARILQELRLKTYDCVVGVNLLREGLDLPEVSLVAIFDADKQGFLRSRTSLIQVAGRAARHVDGEVIMYADTVSPAMREAIEECERRRRIQLDFNRRHGISPRSIEKAIKEGIEIWEDEEAPERIVRDAAGQDEESYVLGKTMADLERRMEQAARNLQFEEAARLRDALQDMWRWARSGRGTPRGASGRRAGSRGKRRAKRR